MTNLEALTYSVNYPLESNHVEPILVKRGLSSVEVFTQEVANSKAYELAYADVLRFVVTMVNLEQGGRWQGHQRCRGRKGSRGVPQRHLCPDRPDRRAAGVIRASPFELDSTNKTI